MPTKIAVLAGGCFWCTEALYKRLRGVQAVIPGYAGGTTIDPSYEQVSTGTTGHAEAIEIEYDPTQIPYEKLLDVFFHTHNPTTLNQQGADVGTQYRSTVFYSDYSEKEIAESIIQKLEVEKVYPDPIVTEILPLINFYPAENYHCDYYTRNQNQGYCSMVISPKITRLMREYASDVKDEFKEIV